MKKISTDGICNRSTILSVSARLNVAKFIYKLFERFINKF